MCLFAFIFIGFMHKIIKNHFIFKLNCKEKDFERKFSLYNIFLKRFYLRE